MEKIRVDLGERSYDICIGPAILSALGGQVKALKPSRVVVVSNPTVAALYGEAVLASLRADAGDVEMVLVPDGEGYKEFLWAHFLYGELLKRRLDRASVLVALGGGVIGDLTGFVASTYMRGIAFVQVPTTLLAQVDSSVGGKTGINHALGKNMIGTFYQPRLVWADVRTLRTLPRREFLAGMAEVIKYGVIRDRELFDLLVREREKILALDDGLIAHIVKRSCEIKAEVVSQDEREGGLRAILNFGHTVGHAVETVTGYATYLHGEAVAIGMHLAARLAAALGLLKEDDVIAIRDLLAGYGLPVELPAAIDRERILAAMNLDKKTLRGRLTFVLPESIGAVRITGVDDREKIGAALAP